MLSAGDIAGRRAARGAGDLPHVRRRTSGWLQPHRARRCSTGLTAEAAVQKVQDDTRARMRAGHRPLSARAAGRSRRPRQPPAAPSDRAADTPTLRAPAGRGDPGRAHHGPGRAARLRPRAAAGRWCWRRARRPRMSRSSPARSTSRCSAASPGPDAAGRRRRSAGRSTATTASSSSGRATTSWQTFAESMRQRPAKRERLSPRSATCRR